MPIPEPYKLPELYTYKNQTHIEQLRIDQYLINCIKLNSYYNLNIVGGHKHIGLVKLLKITYTQDDLLIEFKMINEELLELSIDVIASIDLPSP